MNGGSLRPIVLPKFVSNPETVEATGYQEAHQLYDEMRQFFARNTVGQKPAYGPLLIISGYADPVMTGMTLRVVTRMCIQRDNLQFHRYQDSDFGAVLGDSVRDQLTWIQARFAGRPASSNCD